MKEQYTMSPSSKTDLNKLQDNKTSFQVVSSGLTRKIIFNLIGRPAAWFDKVVVDGFMNLIGNASLTISEGISGMQSGKVQLYASYFLTGAIGLIILILCHQN